MRFGKPYWKTNRLQLNFPECYTQLYPQLVLVNGMDLVEQTNLNPLGRKLFLSVSAVVNNVFCKDIHIIHTIHNKPVKNSSHFHTS